jgi:hypothetical protein
MPAFRRRRLAGAWIGAAAALLGLGTAAADLDVAAFPHLKPLQPPAAARDRPIASFDLDEAVLAASDPAFANLRVVDERGAEVPFLVRTRRERQTVRQDAVIRSRLVSVEALATNRVRILLQNEQPERVASALRLITPQKNYEKQVWAYGSADRTAWRELAAGRPIFDYSRLLDLQNTAIELEPAACAWYRIEVANITESEQSPWMRISRERRDGRLFSEIEDARFRRQDFRIDRLELLERTLAEVRTGAVTGRYAVTDFVAETPRGARKTVVTFRTARAPLTALTLLTEQPNFSRAVIVEGAETEEEPPVWQTLTDATVQRLDTGSFRRDQSTVRLPRPSRCARYRLSIDNRDSPPLSITGIEARGEVYECLFFSRPDGAYRVLYGASEARAPQYDIAAVLREAETAETAPYRLGEPQPNPDYRPAAGWRLLEGRRLLVAAIVLAVLVLTGVIAGALRRVEASPPGE